MSASPLIGHPRPYYIDNQSISLSDRGVQRYNYMYHYCNNIFQNQDQIVKKNNIAVMCNI